MATKRKSPRVTLARVAAHAGVSSTTVSVILSGKEDVLQQFNPETVQRVRQSARELGYHANLFASGLSAAASPFFALVTQEVLGDEMSAWHLWGFEGELMTGILKTAAQKRLYPIIAATPQAQDVEAMASVERVIAGGVFGTISKAPEPELAQYLRLMMNQGHPAVIVFPREPDQWATNAIDVDNRAIGETAGTLLEHATAGPWGIVYYGQDRPAPPWEARINAFTAYAQSRGVKVERFAVEHGHDELATSRLIAPLLRDKEIRGLFAIDSVSSVATLLACVAEGKLPGRDTMIVGCDGWMWQSAGYPRITSVDVSWRTAGIVALEKLIEITGSGKPRFDNVLLSPRTVPADTCPVPEGFNTQAYP